VGKVKTKMEAVAKHNLIFLLYFAREYWSEGRRRRRQHTTCRQAIQHIGIMNSQYFVIGVMAYVKLLFISKI
jgi:hypothetical protein